MNVHGKKVILRAIEEEDLPSFHAWGSDPDLWQLLGGWHFPTSKESTRQWFQKIQGDQLNIRLAVSTVEDGVLGLANLLDIDWKNKHAFHGMMLGNPSVRGKGLGKDTVMAIMRYAFEELGLQRLDGSMIEFNAASTALYCGKCGWKEEGRQRNWYYRRNRFWDKIMVGVTREDYFRLIEGNHYWDGENE